MNMSKLKNLLGIKTMTFSGGIHPHDSKEATCQRPIVDLPPSEEMIYPLSQHLGAPAVPCVAVGDKVCMGQKIAEAGGYVSANIHSAVSGEVIAI